MASSGPRDVPNNRINDRGDNDYNKQRKRSFYSNRRSMDNGSISGVNSASKLHDGSNGMSNNQFGGSRGRFGTVNQGLSRGFSGNMRDSRGSYSSYNNSKGSYSSYNSSSYYNNYGSYGGFGNRGDYSSQSGYYGSRNDNRRDDHTKQFGDNRLSSGASYISNPQRDSLSGTPSPGSSDSRTDKYNSYSVEGNLHKWKSSYPQSKSIGARGNYSPSHRSYLPRDRQKSNYMSNSSSSTVPIRRQNQYYTSRQHYSQGGDFSGSTRPPDKYFEKSRSSQHYYPKEFESQPRENNEVHQRFTPPLESKTELKQIEDDALPSGTVAKDSTMELYLRANMETSTEIPGQIISDNESKGDILEVQLDESPKVDGLRDETNDISDNISIESKDNVFSGLIKPDMRSEKLDENIAYPEGCNYPMGFIDTKFEELELEFKNCDESARGLKYLLARPIVKLEEYPFYSNNLRSFQKRRNNIFSDIRGKRRKIMRKKVHLCDDYKIREKIYEEKSSKMDEQLHILHSLNEEYLKELENIDIRIRPDKADEGVLRDGGIKHGRRNRRHGDLVTTEAEFQEILKQLGKEDEDDPIAHARKGAAEIPDLILDPIERYNMKYMDSNNYIQDREAWSSRMKHDFEDNFSKKEHELFCEGFCLYPKRFGAVSRHMGGLRTPEECVIHYYVTKKSVKYKLLVATFKKKNGRKVSRRKVSRARSSQSNVLSESQSADGNLENSKDDIDQHETEAALDGDGKLSGKEDTPLSTLDKRRASSTETDAYNDGTTRHGQDQPADGLESSNRDDSEVTPEVPGSIYVTGNNGDISNKGDTSQQHESIIHTGSDENGKERKKLITSYWSISESNLFPVLLSKYNLDWDSIAKELGTKTPTMVKNHFHKKAEMHGWNQIINSSACENAQRALSIDKSPLHGAEETKENLEEKPIVNNGPPSGDSGSEKDGASSATLKKESNIHVDNSISSVLASDCD